MNAPYYNGDDDRDWPSVEDDPREAFAALAEANGFSAVQAIQLAVLNPWSHLHVEMAVESARLAWCFAAQALGYPGGPVSNNRDGG